LLAFRERQSADAIRRRKPFAERIETRIAEQKHRDELSDGEDNSDDEIEKRPGTRDGSQSGEEGWRNSEGERLKDFGVDEEFEFYDEQEDDDVPLSELLARKRAASTLAHAH